MSWNATVDRLRARAQHDDMVWDAYTRRLLYEAVDEITRLALRVPNADDLLLVLDSAYNGALGCLPSRFAATHNAIARVRETMEES